MKNKTSLRAPGLKASTVGVFLLLLAGSLGAAIEPPEVSGRKEPLQKVERKVMQVLVDTYGATDWSQVTDHFESYPDDAGNADVMVIPLSLGNAYLNRYEATGNGGDYEQALDYFEWVADKHKLWEKRRLTPEVVHYLAISVDRIRKTCDDYTPLPRVPRERVTVLWRKVLRILKLEAEFRLSFDLPYVSFMSCFTVGTNGEENVKEATLFAAAANFLPEDVQAAAWDEKARVLAHNVITRPSDPPEKSGTKTCTVDTDLTLSNDGLTPNPYHAAATLFRLTQGALTYRLTDRPIPEEFTHNIQKFYAKYTSYLSGDLSWLVSSDPEGDGTLFPLWFDSGLEREAVKQKAIRGYLWKRTPPVPVMGTGSDLWEAIQNAKVVLYYLMSSYLWHFSPDSRCSEVRSTMPTVGEVQ
jgi:hypothetical protein